MENQINNLPKLLTPQDLKKYFVQNNIKMGNDKLYALLKQKDFPSFKIGSNYYIIEKDFIEWMTKQTKNQK